MAPKLIAIPAESLIWKGNQWVARFNFSRDVSDKDFKLTLQHGSTSIDAHIDPSHAAAPDNYIIASVAEDITADLGVHVLTAVLDANPSDSWITFPIPVKGIDTSPGPSGSAGVSLTVEVTLDEDLDLVVNVALGENTGPQGEIGPAGDPDLLGTAAFADVEDFDAQGVAESVAAAAASAAQEAAEETAAAALALHLGDTVDAHDSSAVSFPPTGSIASGNAYDAIVEVAGDAATALSAAITVEIAARNTAIGAAIAAVINGSPSAFDTFLELYTQMQSDESGIAALVASVAGKQAQDADLDAIAALNPANDTVIQRKSGVWVARTMAQIKTDLLLAKADVGLPLADNTPDSGKPVSTAQAAADTAVANAAASDATTKANAAAAASLPVAYLEVDGTAASNSDARVLSTKAMRTYIAAAVAALVNSAPGTLDTLGELAAQLAADEGAVTSLTTVVGSKVAKSLYDANSILAANSDDTPAAVIVGEQTLVGRITGGLITALTPAQIKTLLAIANTDISGLGTASTHAHGDYDANGAASTAVSAHAGTTSGVHGITPAAATLLDDTTIAAMLATLGAQAATGWTPEASLPTYTSGTGTNVAVFAATTDATTRMSVGWKVQFTQTTLKKGIIVALTATSITVYLGTDYTASAANPTTFDVSPLRAPLGFPLDPTKWRETFTDTTNRTQPSPIAATWYNVGSLQLSIPIGSWRVYYGGLAYVIGNSAASAAASTASEDVTLSTANNSESDALNTVRVAAIGTVTISTVTNALQVQQYVTPRPIYLTLAAATNYFLNMATTATGATSIALRGDAKPTKIYAECAYL